MSDNERVMDSKDRAQKVVSIIADSVMDSSARAYLAQLIVAQLDEVAKEAVRHELNERLQNLQDNKAYEAGWNAAREKAKAIVTDSEHCCEDCPCSGHYDEIDAMRPTSGAGEVKCTGF